MKSVIKDYHGVVKSQEISSYEDDYSGKVFEQLQLTLDIPADALAAFGEQVEKNFEIKHFWMRSDDVEDDVDYIKTRLSQIGDRESEINKLLDDKSISAEEKAELREELDYLVGERNHLLEEQAQTDHQIQYASVDLTVKRVARFSHESPNFVQIVQHSFNGFFEMLIPLFAGSLMGILALLPYVLFFGLIYVGFQKIGQRTKKNATIKENENDKTE